MNTRNLSLKEKRKKLDNKHPHRVFRYMPKNLSIFGQDGKRITIGCSRRPLHEHINDSPGPGSYTVKPSTFVIDMPHTIQRRPETSYETMTSDIDFLDLQNFTGPKISIGDVGNVKFFKPDDNPPPEYLPTTPKIKSMTIGPKIPFKFGDDTIPGPGEYNPNEVNRPKSAAFSFTKSSERNVWAQNDMLYNPGPGQYNVIPELKKPKRWAEKLQVHPKIKIQRLSLKEEIRSM